MPLDSGLPVSRLVDIQVSLTTPAIVAPSVNSAMILGTSTVIDTGERARQYADIEAVADDFGTACEEYYSASLWFSQTPSPDTLFIGRWAKTPTSGKLAGRSLTTSEQLMSNWTSVINGGFAVTIDAGPVTQVATLTFAGAANLNAVASAITAKLTPGSTMVWNAGLNRFELTSTTTGPTSHVSFLSTPAAGSDISAQLGMNAAAASQGAYSVAGMASETAVAAAAILDSMFSTQWYALICPSAADADHQQLAAYVEAADPAHYYGVTTSNPGSMDPLSTTDIGYILHNLGYNKSAVQFSTSTPSGATGVYAISSYLGKILTTQWTGQNTTMTLMYKTEPGVAPENITVTQAEALRVKNINVFTTYANGASIVEYGTSCSGEYTDTIVGADALAMDLQTALFNVLYTTPTKVPQTDSGMGMLSTAATAILASYAANGWMAPGNWLAQGFGELNAGDYLQLGYYVFSPSMVLQSASDRAARKAPLMQIAAKLAGAIHTADAIIYVNQ